MSRLDGDLLVTGTLQASTTILSDGCARDKHLAEDADLQASKMIHRYRRSYQVDAPVAGTFCLHVVKASAGALINDFMFGVRSLSSTSSHTSNVVLDLHLNGASILPGGLPIAITANGFAPPTFAGGTWTKGQLCVDGVLYYVLIGTTGSYSTAPNLDPTNWAQVELSTITTSGGPGGTGLAFEYPSLSTVDLDQYDWIDIVIVTAYTGTGTIPTGLYCCAEIDESPRL